MKHARAVSEPVAEGWRDEGVGGSEAPPRIRPSKLHGSRLVSLGRLLIPFGVILLSLAELIAGGQSAISVVATNLPTQPSSSGVRDIDRIHPTASPGRIYHLILEADAPFEADARVEADAAAAEARCEQCRVRIQLMSGGKTRIFLIRRGFGDGSRLRGLIDALRGRARIAVVADRGWLDLGELPADGTALEVQVIGLLPGGYTFAELDAPGPWPAPALRRVTIARPDAPGAHIGSTLPRYQVVRPEPVGVRETLARLVFFVRTSPVLLGAALIAIVSLAIGWRLLDRAAVATGVALLVSSVTLLHAVLSPPLQGADETSQVGTLEWLLWNPPEVRKWLYPRSIALVAEAIEQDRVQFHPDEPLPVGDETRRESLRHVLTRHLDVEAREGAPPPPAADLQVVSLKGPLFYRPFLYLGGVLRRLAVLDRIAVYRLTATVWSLLFFMGGLALLRHAGLSDQVQLLYGFAFLWPYVVAVNASCSNYGPAVGLGFLLAASVLALVLADSRTGRAVAECTLLGGVWLGSTLWPDFVVLASVSSVSLAGAIVIGRLRGPLARGRAAAASGAAGQSRGSLGSTTAWLVAPLGIALLAVWAYFPGYDARLPALVPRPGDPRFTFSLVLILSPACVLATCAALIYALRDVTWEARRRLARVASLSLALILIAMFVVTPHTEVPYEKVFLPLPDLARTHLRSFWSGNFAWDQDRLSWKFLFGAFGWHDVFYPDVVYVLVRWACVGLLISLPVLTIHFTSRRPAASAALLLCSGIVLSLCTASLVIRHAMRVHPYGRFALPYLALAALPVLVQIEAPRRERALRLAFRAAVLLHVWTAIVVLGGRYYLTH